MINATRICILVWALTGCRPAEVNPTDVPPLRMTPGTLELGDVWVGVEARKALTIQNPAKVQQPVSLTVSGPFVAVDFPEQLAAGEEATGWISLTATEPGEFEGVARLGEAQTSLTARALLIPTCAPRDACHLATFDLTERRCVETQAPDETACTASFACFSDARCRAGQCVGTLTTCDDANPCTRDACGETGCVHLDNTFSCPIPTNPCLAPACDVQRGCTSIDVEDGTPCGPRTCDLASICVAGQCRTQAAPQTQSCTDVVAGVPAGPGFVDGMARDARFDGVTSMVYLPNGDLFVADTDSIAGRIRRVSPDGTVRTVAGGTAGSRDGYGRQAQFIAYPRILGLDPRGDLVLQDGFPAAGQLTSLRRMSPSGLVVTECRQCLGDNRTLTTLTPGGEVLSIDMREHEPVTVERRDDLGQVTTRKAIGLRASVAELISIEPLTLTLCGVVNGSARLIHLEDDAPGTFRWRLGAACDSRPAVPLLADGGMLAKVGPADDGPLDVVGLERGPSRWAFDPDGGYALYDSFRFHVRRVDGSNMRTLAGPVPRRGNVDGARSLLESSPRGLAADSSGVWFTDAARLRRLDARVVTTVADAGSVGKDLAWTGAGIVWLGGETYEAFEVEYFSQVNQLTWFSPSGAALLNQTTARTDLSSVAWRADGGLMVAHFDSSSADAFDAGYEPFLSAYRVRAGQGDPRAYVTFDLTTSVSLFQIQQNDDWRTPFLARDAGSAFLSDFYELTPGVIIGVSGRQIVRRDLSTGQQTVVAELSETPTSLAPAPDGGAFVGVPHAILHVRF